MIESKGKYFVDAAGSTVNWRGFNLPAKIPAKMGSFYDGSDVSFVGKPWPLDVADEHARNLNRLGMNIVRFCAPWEAVMHAGPNQFDEEYLTYFEKLVTVFEKHNIYIDIDPHQDDFSRFSGGDGAPMWTFELAGLIPENFYQTVSAITAHEYEIEKKEPIPYLFWQTNLSRLACQTMFTLFWAGNTYAPKLKVQDFLQEQYLLYIEKLAERVKGKKNILCISTMNEISMGYINNTKLNEVSGSVKMGLMPTPLEGWALGDGQILDVERYTFNKLGFHKNGKQLANTQGISVWEKDCIWKIHGVWDNDEKGKPVVLKPNYFQTKNQTIFANEFYKPFAKEFYKKVRGVREGTRVALQTQEFITAPNWDLVKDGSDVMFGQHFYDPILTAFKWYQNMYNAYMVSQKVVFFKYFIDRSFRIQLGNFQKMVFKKIGDVPFFLGETGFEMSLFWGVLGKKGPATKLGNYKYVAKGAQRTFQAIESNFLNATIWNYEIENTLKNGDGWNSEDFSVYCKSLEDPIRAKEGWWRPFPHRTPGTPLHLRYSPKCRKFHYIFNFDSSITAPCEITLPEYLVAAGDMMIRTSGGKTKIEDGMLKFWPNSNKPWVKIRFAGGFSIWKPKTWFSF